MVPDNKAVCDLAYRLTHPSKTYDISQELQGTKYPIFSRKKISASEASASHNLPEGAPKNPVLTLLRNYSATPKIHIYQTCLKFVLYVKKFPQQTK